jgi:hypothetical protein
MYKYVKRSRGKRAQQDASDANYSTYLHGQSLNKLVPLSGVARNQMGVKEPLCEIRPAAVHMSRCRLPPAGVASSCRLTHKKRVLPAGCDPVPSRKNKVSRPYKTLHRFSVENSLFVALENEPTCPKKSCRVS